MFVRGFFRKCPLCGSRKSLFISYFKTHDRCQVCGFKVERGLAGFMTGAMTVNIILTFLSIGFVMVAFFVATFPHPPVIPLILILLVMAATVPFLLRPRAHGMWLAVDLLMRQPEPVELDDALLHANDPHALDDFRHH